MVDHSNSPPPPEKRINKEVKLSFPSILYGLFFDPSVLLLLQHKKVLSSLILIIFLCVLSGTFLFARSSPSKNGDIDKWKKWLEEEVQEFGLSPEGKFYWKFPQQLPHNVQIGEWFILFSDEPFNPEKELPRNTAKKIVWVHQESIVLGEIVQTGNFRLNSDRKLVEYDIGKFLAYFLKHDKDRTITRSEIPLLVDQIAGNFKMISFFIKISSVIFTTLLFPFFSSFLSTISLYLSSKSNVTSSFQKILVVNLYSVIPPMIIATIYALLNLPELTYFTVFFIAFFFYHVLIMKIFRKLILQQQNP